MARQAQKLTDLKAKKQTKPGMVSDGAGLYLHTGKTGNKSWVYRYKRPGAKTPTDMGLGAYPAVGLKDARIRALECSRKRTNGIDPLEHRRQANKQLQQAAASSAVISVAKLLRSRNPQQRAAADILQQLLPPGIDELPVNSFAELAARHIANKRPAWSESNAYQWVQSLRDHCKPVLLMSTADIETSHVRQCLDPIWHDKTEAASRVRGRIETVLDIARVDEIRTGENPARWKGHLSVTYATRAELAPVQHFAALKYQQAPAFFQELAGREALTARALQFLMLTGCRSGEVLGAQWSEIDVDAKLWVIPGARMKKGKEHRVPLSAPALELLARLRGDCLSADGYVFSTAAGKPMSGGAMRQLLTRLNRKDVTVHGMRSCFRDWAAECTNHDFVTCEQALSHAVGGSVQQAYMRGDALEKRRKLMDDWGAWVEHGSNVVPISAAG